MFVVDRDRWLSTGVFATSPHLLWRRRCLDKAVEEDRPFA